MIIPAEEEEEEEEAQGKGYIPRAGLFDFSECSRNIPRAVVRFPAEEGELQGKGLAWPGSPA